MKKLASARAVFILSFALYLIVILLRSGTPFMYDEGWYSLMVKEFASNPGMVMPTLGGVHVEFKPPMFIWVASAFHLLLQGLPLPAEVIFRLPSALFGAAATSLLFMIARRLYGDRTALFAAALYATCPLFIFSSSAAMSESFSMMLALASIYFYVEDKPKHGALFLALLVLTKWLYALMPMLFVTLLYLKDSRLPRIIASFIAFPLALGAYLLLSYFFGDFGKALFTLGIDITRPAPQFDLLSRILSSYVMVVTTFPMSILFPPLLLCFFRKINLREEAPLIILGATAFALPFLQISLFWYANVALPAIAIFMARRLDELDRGILPLAVLSCLALFGVALFFSLGYFQPALSGDVRDAAAFMQGKTVYYVDSPYILPGWDQLFKYQGTPESYLILEPYAPGILYYRFSSTPDYHNVIPVFYHGPGSVPCGDYLVVRKPAYSIDTVYYDNVTLPGCYNLLWETKYFAAYEAIAHTS